MQDVTRKVENCVRARWIVYRVPMACLNLTPRGIAFEVVLFGWIEKEEEEEEDFCAFQYRFGEDFLSLSLSFSFLFPCRGIIRKLRSARSGGVNGVCSSSPLYRHS